MATLNGRPISELREEWQALLDADTLAMLSPTILIASIKDLASKLLILTAGQD